VPGTSSTAPPAVAAARLGAVAGVAAFGWWVTGLRPFTAAAYVAVGATIAAVAVADWVVDPLRAARARVVPHDASRRKVAPWLVLVCCAVVLEVVALALGGRSATVPTLSTVVDHALATHAVRWLLFVVWLVVGSAPVLRRLGAWWSAR